MKKVISLIMALVLCLPLCACSARNKMTKEEMLSAARDFDYAAFSKSIEENKLRAEEAYVGNIYKIDGFIKTINKNSCTLSFLSSIGTLEGDVTVPLSRDELKKLNVNERITVVGDIRKIYTVGNKGNNFVNLGSAYYVGNEFKATVKIQTLLHSPAGGKYPIYASATYQGFLDEKVAPLCNVYLSGEDLATLSEDDEITVVGKMVYYYVTLMPYDIKIIFEIRDAEFSK